MSDEMTPTSPAAPAANAAPGAPAAAPAAGAGAHAAPAAGAKAAKAAPAGESDTKVKIGRAKAGRSKAARHDGTIRSARMTVMRVDPWSVMIIGLLLSVAFAIMGIIAVAILWFVLDSMAVFANMDDFLKTLNNETLSQLGQLMQFGRVMSFAVVVGVIEIVLMTALSAVGALLYNVIAALVGGVKISVIDA